MKRFLAIFLIFLTGCQGSFIGNVIRDIFIPPVCSDTDNGINEGITGLTKKGQESNLDECVQGILVEYHCYQNEITLEFIKCDNTCEYGRCVPLE